MSINGRVEFADTNFTIVQFSGQIIADICEQLEDAGCEAKNRKQCRDSAACELDDDRNCVAVQPPLPVALKEQVENAEPMQQDQSKNSAPCHDATMMASTIVGLSVALWTLVWPVDNLLWLHQ